MTYTAPKTWSTGEALTAADLNANVRDNVTALKSPPTDTYILDGGTNYSTTSATFVDVDATNLELEITTTGGDILVWLNASVQIGAASAAVYLEILVNTVPQGGQSGIAGVLAAASPNTVHHFGMTRLLTGLPAATYTIKLQWRVSAGTVLMFNGDAGTVAHDIEGQFGIREI